MTVRTLSEAMIDQTLADSFPASDPPAWTLGLDDQSGFVAVTSPNEAQHNESDSTKAGVNTHDHQKVLIRFLVPAFLLRGL